MCIRDRATLLFRTVPCNSTVNELRSGESIRSNTVAHTYKIHVQRAPGRLCNEEPITTTKQLKRSCAFLHPQRAKPKEIETKGASLLNADTTACDRGWHQPFTMSTKDMWTRQRGCPTRSQDAVCKQPSSHSEQCDARIWTSSRDTPLGVRALAKCKCNGVAKSASRREAASG